MRAMILEKIKTPLRLVELPIPEPGPDQIQIKVIACGICRTDLHILDGELPSPNLPLIPGHQIAGVVEKLGSGVTQFKIGDRVGVPWLGGSCQHCKFCKEERENLCDHAVYTGYQMNGGYADYCIANARFCFKLPEEYTPLEAAPLLCAGLIGYRSYRMTGNAKRIGFYGFGSAAHILIQVARYEGKEIYAFTREGDPVTQNFAKSLGAVWAGSSKEKAPVKLDAAILFAPDGDLVPVALEAIDKGCPVICAGIHMSDIPSFPYSILWGERLIRSVANLTRKDGELLLKIAPKVPIKTQITVFPLLQLNEALEEFRKGKIKGTAVIDMRI
ncbi:MAG: zinc-dependent alcohol dehydrogenase family protein [Parachlamydiaceae bacterium]|nr:MAG: zinc-dependent alcohol dehydrogenase family protein [Parachlamydiaceae bacterium]